MRTHSSALLPCAAPGGRRDRDHSFSTTWHRVFAILHPVGTSGLQVRDPDATGSSERHVDRSFAGLRAPARFIRMSHFLLRQSSVPWNRIPPVM